MHLGKAGTTVEIKGNFAGEVSRARVFPFVFPYLKYKLLISSELSYT